MNCALYYISKDMPASLPFFDCSRQPSELPQSSVRMLVAGYCKAGRAGSPVAALLTHRLRPGLNASLSPHDRGALNIYSLSLGFAPIQIAQMGACASVECGLGSSGLGSHLVLTLDFSYAPSAVSGILFCVIRIIISQA